MLRELGSLSLRIVVIYFFALVLVRIMGKRELSSLSIFDFIIAVAIGDIIGGPMVDHTIPLSHVLAAIVIVVLLEIVTSYATMKNESLRKLVDGMPTVIIENGQIKERNMAAIRYNLSDLLGKLREKGVTNLADVDFAVVETSGELSTILKPEAQSPSRRDLGLEARGTGIPTVVIKDGRVMEASLRKIGFQPEQLRRRLQSRGISGPEEVLLATVDPDGRLYVDLRDKEGPNLHGNQIE